MSVSQEPAVLPDTDDGPPPAAGSTESPVTDWTDSLIWLARRLPSLADCPRRLGRRGEVELRQALGGDGAANALGPALGQLLAALGLQPRPVRMQPDDQLLPLIAVHQEFGYAVVYALAADGAAMAEFANGRRRLAAWPEGTAFVPFEPAAIVAAAGSATAFFKDLMRRDRLWIPLAALASTLASLLVLATSFYSMQVYDRVIGQGGQSTLLVLTIGVGIAIAIELALKMARSAIMDRATTRIDIEAAAFIYDRLSRVRLDQFPPNVGTLAAQVRGFEQVRAYQVARAVYLWTDAPFSLLFLVGIMAIGGPLLGLVPLVFLLVAAAGGLAIRRGILRHAAETTLVGNKRQGLLVEAVHGIEIVKAFGARWTLQGRWNDLSRRGALETVAVKKLNDGAAHLTGLVQQLSYLGAVAGILAAIGVAFLSGRVSSASAAPVRVIERRVEVVPTPSAKAAEPKPTLVSVTVAPGDSMSRIAVREKVSVEALRAANPQVVNPDQLEVGETLTIPSRP